MQCANAEHKDDIELMKESLYAIVLSQNKKSTPSLITMNSFPILDRKSVLSFKIVLLSKIKFLMIFLFLMNFTPSWKKTKQPPLHDLIDAALYEIINYIGAHHVSIPDKDTQLLLNDFEAYYNALQSGAVDLIITNTDDSNDAKTRNRDDLNLSELS